jgi:hypothetical protein
MKELGIEEFDPEGFTRKVTKSFLEGQSDEWIISLYKFVGPLKALWKQRSSYWNPPGPLLAKSFIRLQNGSHVRPFRDDDSPNAYLALGSDTETDLPIIKTEISQHEDVHQFLKDLRIPELDIVAEVIERILPKYIADGTSSVSIDEHRRDLAKIERAYKTDSQEKKQRLNERLRETPFILAETPGLEIITYRRPTEVYLRNDELKAYFSGNDTIGFVSQVYGPSELVLFQDLDAAESVRIQRKRSNNQGHVSIYDSHGWHIRGLNEFDPDIRVEGLDHAIANPTNEISLFIWTHIAVPHSACIRGIVEKSSKKTYENSKKEDQVSDFGRLLIDTDWLPDPGGKFVKPSKLSLDDLPELFIRDEKLADQLGMEKDVVAKLAEQAGIQAEDIELMRQHPEEFQRWKASIAARNVKPAFPKRPIANPERREERLAEQLTDAPEKGYEGRERSARVTRGSVDPALWLRNQYTNDAGQMVCQICKEEMPFRKRDGEYYFEAVEALSKVYFSREHEAQFLALCPLCAAMYKEFVKLDESAMKDLYHALKNSDEPEVSLQLGNRNRSIRFVESHFSDIRTILGGAE